MRRLLLLLVTLLPEGFRGRFGTEMREQIGRDYERAAARGRLDALRFSLAATTDLLRAAIAEYWSPTWIARSEESTGNEANGRMMMGEVMRDLGHAVRSLSRSPGFTAVTAGTLALAIGTNAGIFTVVDAVLLDPLPFEETERLVVIRGSAPGSELSEEFSLGDEFYLQYRESPLFESVGTYNLFTNSLRVGDQMERALMSAPATSLFETLGVEPILGRLPQPEDSGHPGLDPTPTSSGARSSQVGVTGP